VAAPAILQPVAQLASAPGPEIVLFLDIDGVLHPYEGDKIFDEPCCRLLEEIVKRTGASIVLSSTWRKIPRQTDLVNKLLVHLGLAPIVSRTPDLGGGGDGRDAEICDWVDRHPSVKQWIAIDDMDLAGGPSPTSQRLRGHFVRTEKNTGLTPKDKDLAVHLLTSKAHAIR